jgi:hypothetical protein
MGLVKEELTSVFQPKPTADVESAINSMSTIKKERYVVSFFEKDWKKMIEALINGGIKQEHVIHSFLKDMDKDEFELIVDDIFTSFLTSEEIAEVLAGADLGLSSKPVERLLGELGDSEKDEILSNIIRDYILKK